MYSLQLYLIYFARHTQREEIVYSLQFYHKCFARNSVVIRKDFNICSRDHHYKLKIPAIANGQRANIFSIKLNICFSSFQGESIARNDGMSVISLTYSTCQEHKVSDLRTSYF